MATPPEEKLKRLIKYGIKLNNSEFRKWILKQFDDDDKNNCSLEEFAVYFLNNLRQCAEVHLKVNGNEAAHWPTPLKDTNSNSSMEKVCTSTKLVVDLSSKGDSALNHNLVNSKNDFCTESKSQLPSSLSISADPLNFSQTSTSTPIKRGGVKNLRNITSIQNSTNKSTASNLCLGDFINFKSATNSRSHKKKTTTTATQQCSQKSQSAKPKKRVQPISVSKKSEESSNSSSIFHGESSFSNDNNVLKISNSELDDKDQCAILAARISLASNACEIRKEVINISVPKIPVYTDTVVSSTTINSPLEIPLDAKNLESNLLILQKLADVYTLIIDLNLTTNILNEFSFILNILNASAANNVINETSNNMDQLDLIESDAKEEYFTMLKKLHNAVYFATICLENEELSLACLDSKSLGVVMGSERFSYLKESTRKFLSEIYQRKQGIAAQNPFCDAFLMLDTKGCSNVVYFHAEHNSRENFSSNQEFTNFKAQRDLFYDCLKCWETNHLNPAWKFCIKLKTKIKEIFDISENCINMAHFSKLFVSQLLLSASIAASPEEIGLDMDLLKFSKLSQRLIAPSQFCVDYQFPRAEAFFRDFIMQARSVAFIEHLKIELYTQLTTQNDSSLDHINISQNENYTDEQNVSLMECSLNFVVKPDIFNSMLILAKFLGFVISLPFNVNNCSAMPLKFEKNQVKLRSIMQPPFDVYALLEQAIEQSKLLIAIPWLVQYFDMLDNITLQMENYMRALRLLFAVYFQLGQEKPKLCCSTSLFMLKICLGWLFESKQFITEQYYNYRSALKRQNCEVLKNEFEFVKRKLICNFSRRTDSKSIVLNSYLEALLPTACPFLAEFRVSIMPAKYGQTKSVSRTGDYRHITTILAELPGNAATKDGETFATMDKKKVQQSLIQAFLHSQNPSIRQIIKICTERCYKSTVKDGQMKILMPAKTKADNLVNQITSFEYSFVFKTIKAIYYDAYEQVKIQWKDIIPNILHRRINNALESLLPEEISSVLKKTYFMIIEREADVKISQWFYANIIRNNYFSSNFVDVANKICMANKNKVQLGTNLLIITMEEPSVSDLIDELQYWLHCSSIRVERFKDSKHLVNLLTNFPKSFENELPSFLYNLIGVGIVQILCHLIAKNCSHLSDEVIEAACQVWLHPNMISALDNFYSNGFCIYDAFMAIAFVESLGTHSDSFNQLGHLFITMIKKQVITINYVNERVLSVFKHEWHPCVFTEISNMLKSVAKETSDVPQNGNDSADEDLNEKSTLFMDMLADFSRDLDF